MRHSPTNEKGWIVEVKVLDVEKRKAKEHSTGKNFYEYVLKVKLSDENQYCVFRRYSMFFDLQAGLRQLFQQKRNVIIPELPVARLAQAGGVLFAALAKKQCKHIEEFCQKVIQLPPVVSQSDIVLQFFSQWGTDALLSKPISPPFPLTSTVKDEEQIVEKYRSVAQFNGSGRGEMRLRENEVVTVIEKNHTGWWLVANLKGEHGFAPATFLEPVEGSPHVREEEWREVEDNDRMWIAVESYTAQCGDELTYQAGDDVEVLATSNLGWWKIRIKGAIGLTPGSNLTPKPANDVSYSYETDQRERRSSYSSISGGIYASIRSPPPRRESTLTRAEESRRKAHVSRSASTPHALEYATVEIVSPSPTRTRPAFDFGSSDNDPEYATVIPKHLRVKPRSRSMSETDSGLKSSLKSSLKLKHIGGSDDPRSPGAGVSRLSSGVGLDDDTDPGYTLVRDVRSFRTLVPADDGITRIRSRKYQNVPSSNPLSDTVGKHYIAITNFSPPSDRPEDLALTTGDTVRLLAEDGVWAFVSTVDPAKRRGWVPSSLLKIKGDGELPVSRRSLSVGDITDAIQREDTAAAQSTPHKKSPIPLPRNGLDVKKPPVNVVPSPLGEAPPLPGVPSDPVQKASATIKAYFFALEDFTTGDQNCISVRKGEIGQLLEVTPTGWWKMSVQGVTGWTPGAFWSLLQEDDDSSKNDDGDELSFYGKLSRSKCEEIMMKNSRELDYLIRESAQKFASFVLSVKYGGKIRHFPIEVTPSGRYVIGRHAFSGLTEIVSFYKTHALFYTPAKEPVSLGQPFRGP